MKCHCLDNFGKTVNLTFDGLAQTGINSFGQFQAKKLPKEVNFYVHLNGH